MNVQHPISKILPAVTNEKGYTSRKFVLFIDGQFQQYPQFEAKGNAINSLDSLKPGDLVSVDFDLHGREWPNAKGEIIQITSLSAWRINKVGASQASGIYGGTPPIPPKEQPTSNAPRQAQQTVETSNEIEDLPF
jgi:single-stranded DNA-binding protein